MTKIAITNSKQDKRPKTIWVSFFVILVFFFLIPTLAQLAWLNKVQANVKIGTLNLGNISFSEAQNLLQKSWDEINNNGLAYELNNKRTNIYPIITSPTNPDITYDLITFDLVATLQTAQDIGRTGDIFTRLKQTYRNLFSETQIIAQFNINHEQLQTVLQENFSEFTKPARDASFEFKNNSISLVPEQIGLKFDYNEADLLTQQRLQQFNAETISLSIINEQPSVTINDLSPLTKAAQEFLTRAPFTLTGAIATNRRNYSWTKTINANLLQTWLSATKLSDKTKLTLNNQARDYLERLSEEINSAAQDAKFDINNSGKINKFQTAKNGWQINIDHSYQLLINDLIDKHQDTIELAIDIIEPSITTEAANNLGIREIIGVGRSNFAGSPANRRHNIQVSSDKLNGLLIAPQEEFSLVEALKPFTREAGYKAELVIKGNRLIPEIGGGACQIGTTTFRAALDSGLEISKRKNHSFAVSYYNDEYGLPGTDATIYDPAPDFRFVNNTPNHILIQTHVEEDELIYEFWSAADGRQATTTKPVILATKAAPKTKYIETEDLAPGVTDCSGSNVPGYQTNFTYTVTTADGEIREEDFFSDYRPWQRVCMIGIDKVESEVSN